jgi:hypothetical protein
VAPITVDSLTIGDHLVEINAPGHVGVRQTVTLRAGEEKVLTADLAKEAPRTRASGKAWAMTAAEFQERRRTASTFGAITLEPKTAAVDITAGFIPFANVRLTAGAYRWRVIGIDTGVEFRTVGYFNEAGAHLRVQLYEIGPFAVGTRLFLGGGGGVTKRNDAIFEVGVPISLTFSKLLRFTAHPYVQVYSDRVCPSKEDVDPTKNSDAVGLTASEPVACRETPSSAQQDPRARFTGARLFVQAALEIMLNNTLNVDVVFEGAVPDGRAALTTKYSPDFVWRADPQLYGRVGITAKF